MPIPVRSALSPVLACLCVTCAGAMQNWVQHRDPAGFQVQMPRGYTAEGSEGPRVVIRSPDRSSIVLVQGFFERSSALQWLAQAPQRLAGYFPQARLERSQQTRRQPDEALGAISYNAGGQAGRAVLLCSIWGRSGMLYAIGAPAQQYAARRPELLHILRSFSFTQPAAGRGGGPAPVALNFVPWQDPQQNAFTIEVPSGWRVGGGMMKAAPLDNRPSMQVTSPDGRIRITGGDANLPPFFIPNQTTALTGLREGSWYSSPYGINMMVRRYVPGLSFAEEYVMNTVARTCAGVRITDRRDRRDLSAQITSTYSQIGGGILSQETNIGEVEFTCNAGGQPMQGYYLAGTTVRMASGIGLWNAEYLFGLIAAPEMMPTAIQAAGHMVASVRLNPYWVAAQRNLAKFTGELVVKTHHEISKGMLDQWYRKHQSWDEIGRKRSNVILGQTDVRDPETGETWKVASGHNYYWRRDYTDVVVGTNTYERPDTNFSPLEEY